MIPKMVSEIGKEILKNPDMQSPLDKLSKNIPLDDLIDLDQPIDGMFDGNDISGTWSEKPDLPDGAYENLDSPVDDIWDKPVESDETAETEKSYIDVFGPDGGSYGDMKNEGWGHSTEPPTEVHHMPSDYSSPLETNDGPCIVMDKDDHRETASCGNSAEAREYREKQAQLISEGKYREALQMDIDDIREKFGDKYDGAIDMMLEYVDKLEEEGKI